MPANNSRPVLGAALTIGELERLHNWVMERNRDLELQEFGYAQVLEGDWRPLVDRYKHLLSGHQGRVGIHGPFWGFDIAPHDPDIRVIVRKRLLQGLEVCEALGATHMVVHSPFTTWDYNNLDGAPGERDALFRRCHKAMSDAVKRAEDIGCEIVIENIEDIDPKDRIALAQSFNSEMSESRWTPAMRTTPMSAMARRPWIISSSRPASSFRMSICRTQTAMPTGTGLRARARSCGARFSMRWRAIATIRG